MCMFCAIRLKFIVWIEKALTRNNTVNISPPHTHIFVITTVDYTTADSSAVVGATTLPVSLFVWSKLFISFLLPHKKEYNPTMIKTEPSNLHW